MKKPWASKELAAMYLAALIDGEGCVGNYTWKGPVGQTRRSRVVTIGVIDKELIDAAAKCYTRLGVKYRRRAIFRPECKGQYMHTINVTNLLSLSAILELVPLQHIKKRKKLADAVASFKQPVCGRCSIDLDQRTPGCIACIFRHKYRRRRERQGLNSLPSVPGKTGRPRRQLVVRKDQRTKADVKAEREFNRKRYLTRQSDRQKVIYARGRA